MEPERMRMFPVLRPDIEIHITPGKYILYFNNPYPRPSGFPLRLQKELEFLDVSVGRVLLQADGTKTVEQIAADSVDAGKAIEVIDQYYRRGFVDLVQEPAPTFVRTSGSEHGFYPAHISLEVTSLCNLNCHHCYRHSGSNYEGILADTEQLLDALSRLFRNGLKVVEITGGEPLLHPDLMSIVEYCTKHCEFLALLTNGLLMTQDLARRLGEFKHKLVIGVSIDGATAASHDRLRGVPGSWQQAVNSIRWLSEAGLFVRAGMSITPDTVMEVEETLLLAKDAGAAAFSYGPVIPSGCARDLEWNLSAAELEQFNKVHERLAVQYRGFVPVLPEKTLEAMKRGEENCGAGYKTCVLGPDGTVRPCVMMPTGFLDLGNLFSQSVHEVFTSPVTKFMYTLAVTDKTCGDCPDKGFCVLCAFRAALKYAEKGGKCKWGKVSGLDTMANMDALSGQRRCTVYGAG